MTKTQAVCALRQVSRALKLFAAVNDPQAAAHTWGALVHEMAGMPTTWE